MMKLGLVLLSLVLAACGGLGGGPGSGPDACAEPCAQGGVCGAGKYCNQGCCQVGCQTNAHCAAGLSCFGGTCVFVPASGSDGGAAFDGGGVVVDGGSAGVDGGSAGVDGGSAGLDGGGTTGTAPLGAPCTRPDQCAGGACFTGLPGGYCTQTACDQTGCGAGGTCFTLSSGGSACFKSCTSPSECRVGEGYTCDSDNTCYPGTTTTDGGVADGGAPDGGIADGGPTGSGLLGSACTSGADCAGGACFTSLPGGYCTQSDCTQTGCGADGTCFSLTGGGSACFKNCTSPSECRVSEGYTCDADNTCYPGDAPAECSRENPTGTCPAGQVCQDGTCQTFTCSDTRFEPNDSVGAATGRGEGTVTGLALCTSDVDWYRMTVPPRTIATLGVAFQQTSGDLDLSVHDAAGACLGGRLLHYCAWGTRSYETGEEYVSVFNGAAAGNKDFTWRLQGYQGAANLYSLDTRLVPWTDGRDCGAPYTTQQCQGGGSLANVDLIQFPHPDPADAFVGDGYRFDSMANYRWLRRETIMLVRWAIREVQLKFPGTRPLGLIDMAQRNGITPGYDVNDPRHPESTHDQGGNLDIAYYTTLVNSGLAYNEARIVCDANEGNNDGAYCNASAAQSHVVDLPRQVYFMAKLYESSRLRVIGADRVIAPLLQAEADRQLGLGWITATQRTAFTSKLAFGDGWPYHHHHIHVSLHWWGSGKPRSSAAEPEIGCGFDLRRTRMGRK